ncbi:unnamed protein product, partial [Lampetra planeri]
YRALHSQAAAHLQAGAEHKLSRYNALSARQQTQKELGCSQETSRLHSQAGPHLQAGGEQKLS